MASLSSPLFCILKLWTKQLHPFLKRLLSKKQGKSLAEQSCLHFLRSVFAVALRFSVDVRLQPLLVWTPYWTVQALRTRMGLLSWPQTCTELFPLLLCFSSTQVTAVDSQISILLTKPVSVPRSPHPTPAWFSGAGHRQLLSFVRLLIVCVSVSMNVCVMYERLCVASPAHVCTCLPKPGVGISFLLLSTWSSLIDWNG